MNVLSTFHSLQGRFARLFHWLEKKQPEWCRQRDTWSLYLFPPELRYYSPLASITLPQLYSFFSYNMGIYTYIHGSSSVNSALKVCCFQKENTFLLWPKGYIFEIHSSPQHFLNILLLSV